MTQLTIAESVKEAAQIYTQSGRLLTVANPEYPLAVFADGFVKDNLGENYETSENMTASVEEHFEEVNQETNEVVEDERESIIANVHTAVSSIQFNSHNLIIPAIKKLTEIYIDKQRTSSQADIRVEPFIFDPIHSEPTLTEHLSSRYENLTPLREYRSFILKPISPSEIIELISINNPHVEQQQVTEWALKMPVGKIEGVWDELFGRSRMLNMIELSFLNSNNFPFNIDELTLAYFLTGSLIDEPMEVPGFSVDLEEWEKTLRLLHEVLGHYLLQAYQSRAHDIDSEILVYKYVSADAIKNGKVVVVINNVVAEQWFNKGGSVEAILGAAVSGGNLYLCSDFAEQSEQLIKRWNTVYPLIRQAALDRSEISRRSDIVTTFTDNCIESLEGSRGNPLTPEEFHGKVIEVIRKVGVQGLDNPYDVFASMICEVYFPNSSHKEYLDAVNYYGEMFPEASLRELSTQSLITLVALFLAKQIKVTQVTPDTDTVVPDVEEEPTAEVSEDEVDTEITEDNAEVSEDMDEDSQEPDLDESEEGDDTEEDVDSDSEEESTIDTTEDSTDSEEEKV